MENFTKNKWGKLGLSEIQSNIFAFTLFDDQGRDLVLTDHPYSFNRKPLFIKKNGLNK